MSRNGSGVYSMPPGSLVTNGDNSDATDINTPLTDIEADLNVARPIVAGGTGATSASDARTALSVPGTGEDETISGNWTFTGDPTFTGDLDFSASNVRARTLLTSGSISSAAGVVAVDTLGFEKIEAYIDDFTPSTDDTGVLLQVGTGTLGSPTWLTALSYLPSLIANNEGVLSGPLGATNGFKIVNSCLSTLQAHGRVALTNMNTAAYVTGDSDTLGSFTGPSNQGIKGTLSINTTTAYTLLRLVPEAPTVSYNYEVWGY